MMNMTKANGRNNAMTTSEMETVEQVWPTLAPLLFVPHTEREYDRLVQMLDTLIDVVGEDEDHPLASLMEIIGVLIEKYEDEQVPDLA
jgi:HTH-type transcriptional regulator/antitoxin HigA